MAGDYGLKAEETPTSKLKESSVMGQGEIPWLLHRNEAA